MQAILTSFSPAGPMDETPREVSLRFSEQSSRSRNYPCPRGGRLRGCPHPSRRCEGSRGDSLSRESPSRHNPPSSAGPQSFRWNSCRTTRGWRATLVTTTNLDEPVAIEPVRGPVKKMSTLSGERGSVWAEGVIEQPCPQAPPSQVPRKCSSGTGSSRRRSLASSRRPGAFRGCPSRSPPLPVSPRCDPLARDHPRASRRQDLIVPKDPPHRGRHVAQGEPVHLLAVHAVHAVRGDDHRVVPRVGFEGRALDAGGRVDPGEDERPTPRVGGAGRSPGRSGRSSRTASSGRSRCRGDPATPGSPGSRGCPAGCAADCCPASSPDRRRSPSRRGSTPPRRNPGTA